jgi:hypothetical protein
MESIKDKRKRKKVFKDTLFKYSEEKYNYNDALKEWFILCVSKCEKKCICGKTIFKIFHATNHINDNIIDVGLCCVFKFFKKRHIYESYHGKGYSIYTEGKYIYGKT